MTSSVCKLERVQCGGERGYDVIQDCLLKALDGDGSERHSVTAPNVSQGVVAQSFSTALMADFGSSSESRQSACCVGVLCGASNCAQKSLNGSGSWVTLLLACSGIFWSVKVWKTHHMCLRSTESAKWF